jgi:adenylate cyclase
MASPSAWVTRTRLATGLVLVTYLITHLANHALGLWSLAAMEAGRVWFVAFWRTPVATTALYTALVTHVLLAFWSLYRRNTLRMPAWEASQLLIGLAVPPLLAYHVVGTRLAHSWYGLDDAYRVVVLSMWVLNPVAGLRQTAVVLLAWAHACIGLHFWLRLRPWYPRAAPGLLLAAVLLPLLALLGFAQAGRYVAQRAATPGWIEQTLAAARPPRGDARATLESVRSGIIATYLAGLAGTLVARQGRRLYRRRFGAIRITYPGGREVIVPRGLTVLEASRLAAIPHASVCGGRGRCSTCRVRVRAAPAAVPAPSPEEQRVLARVGAPPGVRLACQLRPVGDLTVTPLLPASSGASASAATAGRRIAGEEREIAIFFADLRGFTKLAEHKLPYDVVFILNRYFETVGGAIKRAGGVVNQFTGDGVMALFGLESGPEAGSRQALLAAARIVSDLAGLSRQLAGEIDSPLRMGMGIHAGPTVVGQMGYEEGLYLTAVGDTVHVASRLEQLTKEHGCPLVISADVAVLSGLELPAQMRREVSLRHRESPLAIYLIADPAALPALLASPIGLASPIPLGSPSSPFSRTSTPHSPPERAP